MSLLGELQWLSIILWMTDKAQWSTNPSLDDTSTIAIFVGKSVLCSVRHSFRICLDGSLPAHFFPFLLRHHFPDEAPSSFLMKPFPPSPQCLAPFSSAFPPTATVHGFFIVTCLRFLHREGMTMPPLSVSQALKTVTGTQ